MVLDKRYRIFFHKKQLIINTKKYICDSSIDSSHNYIYISELGLGGVPSSSLSHPWFDPAKWSPITQLTNSAWSGGTY